MADTSSVPPKSKFIQNVRANTAQKFWSSFFKSSSRAARERAVDLRRGRNTRHELCSCTERSEDAFDKRRKGEFAEGKEENPRRGFSLIDTKGNSANTAPLENIVVHGTTVPLTPYFLPCRTPFICRRQRSYSKPAGGSPY